MPHAALRTATCLCLAFSATAASADSWSAQIALSYGEINTTSNDGSFDDASAGITTLSGTLSYRPAGPVSFQLDLEAADANGLEANNNEDFDMHAVTLHAIYALSDAQRIAVFAGLQGNDVIGPPVLQDQTSDQYYVVGLAADWQVSDRVSLSASLGIFDERESLGLSSVNNWYNAHFATLGAVLDVTDAWSVSARIAQASGFVEGDDDAPFRSVELGAEYDLPDMPLTLLAGVEYIESGNESESDRFYATEARLGLRIHLGEHGPRPMDTVARLFDTQVAVAQQFD